MNTTLLVAIIGASGVVLAAIIKGIFDLRSSRGRSKNESTQANEHKKAQVHEDSKNMNPPNIIVKQKASRRGTNINAIGNEIKVDNKTMKEE